MKKSDVINEQMEHQQYLIMMQNHKNEKRNIIAPWVISAILFGLIAPAASFLLDKPYFSFESKEIWLAFFLILAAFLLGFGLGKADTEREHWQKEMEKLGILRRRRRYDDAFEH